ncbi:MurR/RpiR family transcriptional regulator [Tomitella gaofuii]|uniref:MurR/RpiR family transcriptional regulator n=1 Tax=Tomitella gaofuii TaxID=2760083 RepID=UPI0015FB94C7|nr:MurR/RpiR family transcriptional regulator [Tomitella gaofuii]
MTKQSVATEAPETFDGLLTLIHSRFDTLSPSHKQIAERIMVDPESVAFMTVSDLAAAVDVNEATVVRFASGLGLKGFPGLVALCRDRLRQQAQMLRRFENLEHMEGDLRAHAAASDQANITRTFSRIDDATWTSAADALARAPRVHVMGLRKTHAPAYLLGYLLGMLREEVDLVTGNLGGLTDALRRVRTGDCFVAVSIHRYSTDTVRAAEFARNRGAHVITLTDNPSSPLAASGHDVFYLDAASPFVLRSMTAFTALGQALCAEVAQRLGRSARDSLLEEEELLSSFGVYAVDGR